MTQTAAGRGNKRMRVNQRNVGNCMGPLLQAFAITRLYRPLAIVVMLCPLAALPALGQTAKSTAPTGIQYVSPNGSDSNDGFTWRTAKLTVAAACAALPAGNPTCTAGTGKVEIAPSFKGEIPPHVAAGISLVRGSTTIGRTVVDRLNGVYKVGGPTYPCTSAGINAANAAAASAGGGVIDARGCNGTITMSEPIVIGDTAGRSIVAYFGPGTWKLDSTAGASACGIEQYGGSQIIGPSRAGGNGAQLNIAPVSSSRLYAWYCTDEALSTGAGKYYGLSGILIHNTSGAITSSGYAAVFSGLADGSTVEEVTIADYTNKGALVVSSCCGASFYTDVFNGNHSGGTPLTVGETSLPVRDVSFYNISVDHPRSGEPNLRVTGGASSAWVQDVNFYGLYEEGNKFDTRTAFNVIERARGVNFFGPVAVAMSKHSLQYAFEIARSRYSRVDIFEADIAGTPNGIDDLQDGMTVKGDSRGWISQFVMGDEGAAPIVTGVGSYRSVPVPFSSLAVCGRINEGALESVSNSNTTTWGAAVAGGGTNLVLAFCDGKHWTVSGK